MKIIFVDSDVAKQDFYKNVLKDITEEIHFFTHPIFLLNHFREKVIPYQLHVDLIITDIHFVSNTISDIVDFFRQSGETYSHHNFKLSSIPILVHTEYFDSPDVLHLNVNAITPKPLNENNTSFSDEVLSLVKSWRKGIFDDLDVLGLGLDFNFSKSDVGYAVRVKADKTKILSKAFLILQQKLPYQWLSKDFFELESSIEELETLVNHYMDLPMNKLERKRWEDQLQDFFERNPKFLFESNFFKYWSQPKLSIANSDRFYRPDFIVQPATSFELGKNWDVIDLKLPVQDFLQATTFHPTFTAKFFKCLKQIKDYQNYFKENVNKGEIERVLGFHPRHPKLTLVVGRRNVLFEQQDKIYENLEEFNLSDIFLLTYDEVIEKQKKYLEFLIRNQIM